MGDYFGTGPGGGQSGRGDGGYAPGAPRLRKSGERATDQSYEDWLARYTAKYGQGRGEGGSTHVNRERAGDRFRPYDYNAEAFAPTPGGQMWGTEAQRGYAGTSGMFGQGYEQSQDWYRQQQELADMLRARAEGRGGPSLAELQMQRGLDATRAQMASAAASAEGVSPAIAMRNAMQQGATIGQQGVGQMAQLRAQEQLGAQQALGQLLGQARGQELQGQGLAGQLMQGFMQQGMSYEQAQQQAQMALEQMRGQQHMGMAQLKSQEEQARLGKPREPGFWDYATDIAGAAIGALL